MPIPSPIVLAVAIAVVILNIGVPFSSFLIAEPAVLTSCHGPIAALSANGPNGETWGRELTDAWIGAYDKVNIDINH